MQFDSICELPKDFLEILLRRVKLLAVCSLCLLALIAKADDMAPLKPSIDVYISVDWEGWSLEQENLEAMAEFRKRFPQIPLWHFLNPVYWARQGANLAEITRRVRSVIRPGDSLGLHLHGWKQMLVYCGLQYQSSPGFEGHDETCATGDCGYMVSLEMAYDEATLGNLLACSIDVLNSQGFGRVQSFRAGGWQQGPKLAAALRANGFLVDSSRTDPAWVAAEWGSQSPLVVLLKQLHPNASVLDQPVSLLPGLMEYPDNGSLADYTRTKVLVEAFKKVLDSHEKVFVTGFHQETAFNFLSRLEQAIPEMEAAATAAGVTIHWSLPPELAFRDFE